MQYLKELFDSWIGSISSTITLITFVAWLLPNFIELPAIHGVWRELLICIAFASFTLANMQIYYKKNTKIKSFLVRLIKIESARTEEKISLSSHIFGLPKKLRASVSLSFEIENLGTSRSVQFAFLPNQNRIICAPNDGEIELTVKKQIKHEQRMLPLSTPLTIDENEIISDLIITVNFALDVCRIESLYGAIRNLPSQPFEILFSSPNLSDIKITDEIHFDDIKRSLLQLVPPQH